MMKKTKVLLLLSSAVALSSSYVVAMKRKAEPDTNPKPSKLRKIDEYQGELPLLKTNLSPELKIEIAMALRSDVATLKAQYDKLAEINDLFHVVNEYINQDLSQMSIREIAQIIEQLEVLFVEAHVNDTDFNLQCDVNAPAHSAQDFLTQQMVRMIAKIRQSAENLVAVISKESADIIADVSTDASKHLVTGMVESFNQILAILGYPAIDLKLVMMTENDDEIAREEYKNQHDEMIQNDAMIAFEQEEQDRQDQEAASVNLARQLTEQGDMEGAAPAQEGGPQNGLAEKAHLLLGDCAIV